MAQGFAPDQKLTIQQVHANRREAGLVARAQDVKILL